MHKHTGVTAESPELGGFGGQTAATAIYGVAVLIIATIFAMLNRKILTLLAQPIGVSLDASDGQIGFLLGGGLTLFIGLAAVPVGWLADRWGREKTLCVCVLVWSLGTSACGLAPSYTLLFVAAAMVGIGEAGLSPIAFALIPDIVPERRRVFANSVYQLAVYLGSGVGLLLGGALLERVDGLRPLLPLFLRNLPAWRLAFFAAAAPAPIVAGLVLLIRARRATSFAGNKAGSWPPTVRMRPFIKMHLTTLALIFSGLGFGVFGLNAIATWIPTVVIRVFGVAIADVGKSIGSTYLVATLIGAFIGILGARQLRARFGAGGPTRAFAIGMLVASLTCAALMFARTPQQIYILFGLQVTALIAVGALTPTLIQDMAPPALRSRVAGTAVAVGVTMSALSPVAVGLVSEALRQSPQGILTAVAVVGALGFACGAVTMYLAQSSFVETVTAVNTDLLSDCDY
jgi:MFS family permease